VRPEGLGKLEKEKKSFTLSRLEPLTGQLAASCLNHYATACPNEYGDLAVGTGALG
jgi:hypothetical protein